MSSGQQPGRAVSASFRLASWLVQPHLNRLCGEDEEVVQLEPKLMDVLTVLAGRAGEVVSKEEITDAVWTDQFITESVITRAIAGLRRALGDNAQQPRYIETISKRGYRLVAPVSVPAQEVGPKPSALTAVARPQLPATPFVVGQWVRGELFYGRAAQISEILQGNRNGLWLLGTRGIGKTSLLKQLEHLTSSSPALGYLPLFWDLQGTGSPEELHRDFADTLHEARDRLQQLGIEVTAVAADDLFTALGRLRRELSSRQVRLLLLCDEVEELIQLNQQDPTLLRKLRRALQSREGIRSVLASSIRLWVLAEEEETPDTSPFLHGFTPPLYIEALRDEEARLLIRQTQLGSESRPTFRDDEVEEIRRSCGNHPYLIQLLCRRYLELGDLSKAIEDVASAQTVSFFFSVDFDMLNAAEQSILLALARQPTISSSTMHTQLDLDQLALTGALNRLERLGFLRRSEDHHRPASHFLRRWLQQAHVR